MFNFYKNFKKKISLNLKFFIVKNLASRVQHYRYLGFNSGFLFGYIKKAFLTIHLRPKYSSDINFKSTNNNNSNKNIAILIQGPWSINNDDGEFLEESIKIYKKIFGCKIVLSTWRIPKIIKKKIRTFRNQNH